MLCATLRKSTCRGKPTCWKGIVIKRREPYSDVRKMLRHSLLISLLYPEEIIRAGDKKRDFILTPEILRTTMDGREGVNG